MSLEKCFLCGWEPPYYLRHAHDLAEHVFGHLPEFQSDFSYKRRCWCGLEFHSTHADVFRRHCNNDPAGHFLAVKLSEGDGVGLTGWTYTWGPTTWRPALAAAVVSQASGTARTIPARPATSPPAGPGE